MKKGIVLVMGGLLLLSSCGSYTATGAMVGGQFGQVIGSAVGGITGGPRGHDLGSLIGTVGGVVAGAAVGAAVDNAQQRRYDDVVQQQVPRRSSRQADDRIVMETESTVSPLEIRHVRFMDATHDGILTRGEECTVVFEIMNNTHKTVYDVYPMVTDVTGNKHVKVSPSLRIESISPLHGVRYTATILADKKLKDGEIAIRIGVSIGWDEVTSQTREFTIPTKKGSKETKSSVVDVYRR